VPLLQDLDVYIFLLVVLQESWSTGSSSGSAVRQMANQTLQNSENSKTITPNNDNTTSKSKSSKPKK
jgi:hypothetical protein